MNWDFLSKDKLDRIAAALSILFRFIIAVAMLVMFSYCAGEGFIPDGLSFGDAFPLVWIVLGFAVLIVIGTLYGVISLLFPVRCLMLIARKFWPRSNLGDLHPRLRGWGVGAMSVFCLLGFLFVGVYTYFESTPEMRATETIAFFLFYGFLLVTLLGVKHKDDKPLTVPVAAFLIGLTFFGGLIALRPTLLNFVMSNIGLRSKPGALIVLSNTEYARFSEMVQRSGLKVDFCQLAQSSEWATRDARAVWYGVGTTSYVRLMDQITGGKRNILMPVARTELRVIRPERVALVCS